MGFRNQGTVLAAYEGLGECTLEYNRNASAPQQGEVLVAVLISRSPKEVRTYLHVQVREETARLSHVRQLLYDYLRAGKAWKAPHTEEFAETKHSNVVPMDVDSLHRKGGKGKKGKGKSKNKSDRRRHDGKGKGEQSVKQRYFDGYCNQCCEHGHKKPGCAGKNKFFNGTCNKCGAHGHKRVDCPVKTVAHLESESVIEPNEEPPEIEYLEWLYALEHDGEEAMGSLTDEPVRLLLDSGSGASPCSPEFAPHVKTLTGSSVRARSATGQVTKSLGKKIVNFDINGIAAGVHMEVLKISKPIVSAVKMVRSGRRIVLEHDSFIENKRTGKRIPVELTRGDLFEISAYMSQTPTVVPKKPVVICPNEVEEAEDPGYEELDESMPEPDVVPRGEAVPENAVRQRS